MSRTSNVDQESGEGKEGSTILLRALTPINALYYNAGNEELLEREAITGSKINNQPLPRDSSGVTED